jgi:hypothetical protein
MIVDKNIDKTAEAVKGFKMDRQSTRTAKAIKEINALGRKINEEYFDAICEKYGVKPENVEAIMYGEGCVKRQMEGLRKHLLTYRSITNSAALKKYGCVRFDARMAEVSRIHGIVFNRRVVKASNGVEYIRYELIRR